MIRRDNIGDLILTTPLIHALRLRFPAAWIGALVNSYNARVLEENSDLDEVFIYTKAKHRGSASILSAYWSTLSLILRLRKLRVDYAILASPAASSKAQMFALKINARTIVGFGECTSPGYGLTPGSAGPLHEVEEAFRIAPLFGIKGPPPRTAVFANERKIAAARSLVTNALPGNSMLIGVHISARKMKQRWPAGRFVEFLRQLVDLRPDLAFVLFWSPGESDSPTHPGDDAKAHQILEQLGSFPIIPFPTVTLSDLFAGLAVCEQVICSDGGAMHVAAALGKPILCFFGDSDADRWHPWKVPYQLMRPQSEDVSDISVAEALEKFRELQSGI
ncbi:MAG: glycosyltransferase family 9 protein [Betaproteobacteria bacterium]|nr:glycosyltransferase family 9 protein [Betaproteobacteria bacterium]